MKCSICSAENWYLRTDLNPLKKVGICKECGYISFFVEPEEEEKLLEFYRKDYRSNVTINNLITTNRKLHYIKIFMADFLKDKKNLVCGDVGAATGYIANWLRTIGHKATGCEYTTSFRRFSENYYGIPLTETLEKKHKYDLITIYHVLEHMSQPDVKLKEYRDMLSDNGVIMISVPEWLYELIDLSAFNQLSRKNYFHENHINCFTNQSFRNLLAKCGLKPVKYDRLQYGITVLVEKCEPANIIKENWQEINKKIDTVCKAIDLFVQGKYKEACDEYPVFPDAQLRLVFDAYKKDPERQKDAFNEIESIMPDNLQIKVGKAIWLYQYEKYEEAYNLFKEICKIRPNEDYYVYMAWCLERLGQYRDAMKFHDMAIMINPQKWAECTNWVCAIASKMPAWDEKAEQEIKDQMFQKVKHTVQLNDPVMEPKKELKIEEEKEIKKEIKQDENTESTDWSNT